MEVKFVNREEKPDKIIKLREGIYVGGEEISVMAGPCAIESREEIMNAAENLSKMKVKILRGGAFKPRTSPYSFQGLGFEGLKYMREAADKFDMAVVSEIMDPRDVEEALKYVDMIQIGSRNMQNYSLLKEVGKTNKPVLLKRGMTATVKEWIMAAEYIASEGNEEIVFCERGIRTFENITRNTLDLTVVPILKSMTNLPVIVDPSHGTGRRDLVRVMSRASIASGADGIMIEVHRCPDKAISDSEQTIDYEETKKIITDIQEIQRVIKSL